MPHLIAWQCGAVARNGDRIKPVNEVGTQNLEYKRGET
jgi:hypothetical protein